MKWPNGAYYEGQFYEGKMHGKGILVRADGTVGFEGQYSMGHPVPNKLATSSGESVSSHQSAHQGSLTLELPPTYVNSRKGRSSSMNQQQQQQQQQQYFRSSQAKQVSMKDNAAAKRGNLAHSGYQIFKENRNVSHDHHHQHSHPSLAGHEQDLWDQISHYTGGSLADI